MTLEIEGLNLEKLIREAPACGVRLKSISRSGERRIRVQVSPGEEAELRSLCARFGWEIRELRADATVRVARFIRRRWTLAAALALCLGLLHLADSMILYVDVQGAQENAAEVRRVLDEEGAKAGRLKAGISLSALRDTLMLRLPGLKYVSMRYAGSVLEISCQLPIAGEQLQKSGESLDLIAARAGIITRIAVSSGTPQVEIGQAVHAGQVLVRGEERSQKGGTVYLPAQAQVTARVWAQGEARVSLVQTKTIETGRTRTRVTLHTPWHAHIVSDAQPFDMQDVSVEREKIVGLYLPLWREIETFVEIETESAPRNQTDACSQAQAAAQEIAKKQCPAGAEILDKWVDYSMIDNEFVYATVVLEYEQDIAVRAGEP